MKPAYLLLFFLPLLPGCAQEPESLQPTPVPVELYFDFARDEQGWSADFADYPAAAADLYHLEFDHARLPDPLDRSQRALRQSGFNRNDDLFMFVKRRVDGLVPGHPYEVRMTVGFATDIAAGSVGVFASPADGVYLKAGAAAREPLALLADGSKDRYELNVDKGQDDRDGADAHTLGNFSNGTDRYEYALKSLTHTRPVVVTASAEGTLWLLTGVDSGYEGETEIYYSTIRASLTPLF